MILYTHVVTFLSPRNPVYHRSLHQLRVCRGASNGPATEALDQEGRGHAVCPQLLTVVQQSAGDSCVLVCAVTIRGMWVQKNWGWFPVIKDAHFRGVPFPWSSRYIYSLIATLNLGRNKISVIEKYLFCLQNIPSNFTTCIIFSMFMNFWLKSVFVCWINLW